MSQLFWYLNCWFPSFVLLSPITSTIYCWSCWGILISLLLLLQIVTDQPEYSHLGRCHIGITSMCDFFVRGCAPYLVSLSSSFQLYRPDFSLLFHTKRPLWSRIFVAVLILSEIPLATIHPIVPHVKRFLLVHIHLHQEPLSLCQPCRYLLK